MGVHPHWHMYCQEWRPQWIQVPVCTVHPGSVVPSPRCWRNVWCCAQLQQTVYCWGRRICFWNTRCVVWRIMCLKRKGTQKRGDMLESLTWRWDGCDGWDGSGCWVKALQWKENRLPKNMSSSKNVENFSSICMRFQYTHRLGQDQALYWSPVSKLFVISE